MDDCDFIESLLCCCLLLSDEPYDNSNKVTSSTKNNNFPVVYGTLVNENNRIKRE